MNSEIIRIASEKGLLLEKEIYDLLSNFENVKLAESFLDHLVRCSGQKMITKSVLYNNVDYIQNFVRSVSAEGKGELERVFVKYGFSVEIRKEKVEKEVAEKIPSDIQYQIFYANTNTDKKIDVGDFVNHFKARYQQMQRFLMQRPELSNLVSINKISSNRQQMSIIGIVTDKRITKNKNMIIAFEDLTGKIQGVVKCDREEIFSKAKELQFDDIVAIKASGNRDMLFIQDIIFPDSFLHEKTKFETDASIAFLSDIHTGSVRHLGKSFEKFLDWLEGDDENAQKIKFIFISGDNVDGVGIFPGQEHVLDLKSMKEQYTLLASYLKRVPKHITMFLCPGQHDAVRVAEPQPIIGKHYASPLYELENLILVTNPTLVKLIEKQKEFKVLMYHGASIHTFINEIPELREMKAHKCPAKAVRHMLKRRHLAPTHGDVVYIPNAERDPMVIQEVPDVLCTGEVHRLDIETYNGTLIITGSCWQAQTPFEEKVGNIPDPCKVPVLNLKTRELKIFDFTDDDEMKEMEE